MFRVCEWIPTAVNIARSGAQCLLLDNTIGTPDEPMTGTSHEKNLENENKLDKPQHTKENGSGT